MITKIEKGKIEDLSGIAEVNFSIFHGMYEDDPYSLDQYKEKLAGKEALIYRATVGEKLVGDSIAFERDNAFYIWILGVMKSYRKNGIGGNLLDENESEASKKGLRKVTIKVYGVSGEMRKLLEKRGYKIEKSEPSKIKSKYDVHYYYLNI